MNKKLLIATMSLAALAACSTDDFESQKNVAEEVSPIKFEVVNNAVTRASMGGELDTKIIWNANDNDLFTLYHGGTISGTNLTGFQNATYKAIAGESGSAAQLTTPSVIVSGSAIMTWPVDTVFTNDGTGNLAINIPATLENIENKIPYVSDLINIGAYAPYSTTPYNTAGYARTYPVFMRPMASQLILNADYAGSDAKLAQLYPGGSAEPAEGGIAEIAVESIDLTTQSGGSDEFTTQIPLTFTAKSAADNTRWNTTRATRVPNNSWSHVTGFGTATAQVDKLTTKVVKQNKEARFLILPQATIAGGVDDGTVVVNTNYGKVVVASGILGRYDATTELNDAWYRYIAASTTVTAGEETKKTTPETSGDGAGKYKAYTTPALGMQQTINHYSTYTHQGTSTVMGEPEGTASVRYVKVLLKYLDMTDLHIKNDKQLRDAAYVWKHMGLADVTVFLDGDASNEFEISQQTIQAINTINASVSGKSFKVKPCNVTSHKACNTIVITGGGNVQDIAFIEPNTAVTPAKVADVALKAGENWQWKAATTEAKTVRVKKTGVKSIINRGTLVCDANAILQTAEPGTPFTQNNIPFVNAQGATWNVTAGTLRVQFDVTNYGTVKIEQNAQYRVDGAGPVNAPLTTVTFVNQATAIPGRFVGGDDALIGKVKNEGVFATIAGGEINNYGEIYHDYKDAKTYITRNETTGASFSTPFGFGGANKMGSIILPYGNKDEDNISISAAAPNTEGFVSVEVNGEVSDLNTSAVGAFVNSMIVKSGVEKISALPAKIKYVEIRQPGTEIAWSIPTSSYTGLTILSDVNIKLNTTVNATVTYLGADMYVGGTFNNATTNWYGYYGDTSGNVATKYVTY